MKSKLKNRKINTIDHILIDYLLIKQTKFWLLTNCTSSIKPLPAKSLTLISLSLLLSLFLLLLSTINFFIPLISSHNLFCYHLNPKYKVLFYFPIITLSSVYKMKSFSKYRRKKKVIPIEWVFFKDFLKKPYPTSISWYFWAMIPFQAHFGLLILRGSTLPIFLIVIVKCVLITKSTNMRKLNGLVGIISYLLTSILRYLSVFWGLARLYYAKFYAKSTKTKNSMNK